MLVTTDMLSNRISPAATRAPPSVTQSIWNPKPLAKGAPKPASAPPKANVRTGVKSRPLELKEATKVRVAAVHLESQRP